MQSIVNSIESPPLYQVFVHSQPDRVIADGPVLVHMSHGDPKSCISAVTVAQPAQSVGQSFGQQQGYGTVHLLSRTRTLNTYPRTTAIVDIYFCVIIQSELVSIAYGEIRV